MYTPRHEKLGYVVGVSVGIVWRTQITYISAGVTLHKQANPVLRCVNAASGKNPVLNPLGHVKVGNDGLSQLDQSHVI